MHKHEYARFTRWHVLKTESSENKRCSQCDNPSYARSEKRSGWGNKQCAGFYYSHMTKNHSLSALTAPGSSVCLLDKKSYGDALSWVFCYHKCLYIGPPAVWWTFTDTHRYSFEKCLDIAAPMSRDKTFGLMLPSKICCIRRFCSVPLAFPYSLELPVVLTEADVCCSLMEAGRLIRHAFAKPTSLSPSVESLLLNWKTWFGNTSDEAEISANFFASLWFTETF